MPCCCQSEIGALGWVGDTSASECDKLATIVTKENLAALKLRVDQDMQSTNAEIEKCTRAPEEERARWRAFFMSWQAWKAAQDQPGWDPVFGPLAGALGFGMGALWDQACAFSKELAGPGGWKERMKGFGCDVAGPEHIEKPGEASNTMMKWIAGAAVVVGIAYVVKTVVR